MKILFLCGSLEPGRDGVGDYTRRLAAELIRQGHNAGIVALYDLHITEETNSAQESDGIAIPVFRVPSNWPLNERCLRASLWIDDFSPEWLSLQFVPFSFHQRGLAFGLSKYINHLTRDRKLHIMFHELWVGMNKEASFKLICWGYLQRIMINNFIKKIKPLIVHTQTKLYQVQLKKMGINATLLSLFSNIRVVDKDRKKTNAKHLRFVVFGGIHPGAPIDAFAKEVAEYANGKNLMIRMTFIGRCGLEQEHWAAVWRSYGLEAIILGELPEERISLELSKASIGIANTPYYLLEKSGASAAMKEHGLPVICLSHNFTARGIPNDIDHKKTPQYSAGNLGHLLNTTPEYCQLDLSVIADSFVTSLHLKHPEVSSVS